MYHIDVTWHSVGQLCKVYRSDLKINTSIEVGGTYVIYPHNPRKKNRGRSVTVLSLNEDKYVEIKYCDNNRHGRAELDDLICPLQYDKLQQEITIADNLQNQ